MERRCNGVSWGILKRNTFGNWTGFTCLATHENTPYSHRRKQIQRRQELENKQREIKDFRRILSITDSRESGGSTFSCPFSSGCITAAVTWASRHAADTWKGISLMSSFSGKSAGARCSNPWPDHIRSTVILDLDHDRMHGHDSIIILPCLLTWKYLPKNIMNGHHNCNAEAEHVALYCAERRSHPHSSRHAPVQAKILEGPAKVRVIYPEHRGSGVVVVETLRCMQRQGPVAPLQNTGVSMSIQLHVSQQNGSGECASTWDRKTCSLQVLP